MNGDLFHELGLKETMSLAELAECLDLKGGMLLTLTRQYDIPLVQMPMEKLEQG